jgi:hypothetical protein
MKTAMQELVERLDKTEKQLENENNLGMSSALYAARSMAEELLEKEKEQIINACNSAFEDKTTWGERYYNQNYNNGI